MKKLTEEQVEARMEMYDECIDHLGMSVCEEGSVEREQADILIRLLRNQSSKWYAQQMRKRD